MTEQSKLKASEAQQLMDGIDKARGSAINKLVPSYLFCASLTLLTGMLLFLAAYNQRQLQIFVLVGIALLLVYRAKNVGIKFKQYPVLPVVVISAIMFFSYFGLIIVSGYFASSIGILASSLAAAGCFALMFFVACIIERNWLLKNLEGMQ